MIDYSYIKSVSNIAVEINKELLLTPYSHYYNPISVRIVRTCSCYNKLAMFLLFKTLLRFSDLQNFKLKEACENEHFEIRQRKTRELVAVNFFIYNKNLKDILRQVGELKNHLNYESIRNELKRITPQPVRHVLLSHNSATHLFRHLEASFMASRNFSKESIAERLGHQNETSQLSYIHDFPNFSVIL